MSEKLCTTMLLVCLVVVSPSVPLRAAQDAGVRGTVTDVTGGVIIGAEVTLTATPEVRLTALTDANGQFQFAALPQGTYRLRITADGFAPFEVPVAMDARGWRIVNATLQVSVRERVEVAVVPATLSAAGGLTTTTLSGAALDVLPDDPDSLLRRLQELAGATGQSGQISISVDGFRQSIRLPPKEAIQMIRISANPFAPEFAELGRARIDVVTKPGAAAVHADIRGSFNDAAMNARNPLAPRRADERTRNVSGYISSPIVPNRWSVVAYGGRWSMDQSQAINASVIDPGSPVTRLFSATVVTPSRLSNMWLGTDVRLAAPHTLALSYGRTDDRADNQGLSSGLDLPERAFTRRSVADEFRLGLTSIVNARMLNEIRIQAAERRSSTRAVSDLPAVLVLDAFNAGGNQSALANDTRNRNLQASERFTMTAGTHTLKFGADVEGIDRRQRDRTNFGGTFLFGADVERDRRGLPITTSTGAVVPISPVENYRRVLAEWPGYAPSQFSVALGNPDVDSQQWWAGWFAQDDWAVRPRLTLSYGVRHDWQTAARDHAVSARAALAWALDTGRVNTIRAGGGLFAHRIEPELAIDVLRTDTDHQQQLLVERPQFFAKIPPALAGAVTTLVTAYTAADRLATPQTARGAVSYERQLPRKGLLSVTYDVQYGRRLLRTRNINAPPAGGVRPDPTRGPVLQFESTGQLRRHEVSAGWRWAPTSRLNGFATYSFVHARSDTDGRTTVPADSYLLDGEFWQTAEDRPHQMSAGMSVTFPGGVIVSPFVTRLSGRAFNITTGFDDNGDGLFSDRPALAEEGDAAARETPYGRFELGPSRVGALIPRNFGREPRQARVDVHVSKMFRFGGSAALQIAGDVQNVFDWVNFAGVNGVLAAPDFGRPKVALNPRRALVTTGLSF